MFFPFPGWSIFFFVVLVLGFTRNVLTKPLKIENFKEMKSMLSIINVEFSFNIYKEMKKYEKQ